MACPWANIKKPEPVNLTEIMSEEVARDLQAKENEKFCQRSPTTDAHTSSIAPSTSDYSNLPPDDDIPEEELQAISNDMADSDALLAKVLQMEYDKEYNDMLTRTEQKYNGDSKIKISFENFKRNHENFDFENSEEEEIDDNGDKKDWDRFDRVLRDITSIPVCGYRITKSGEVITKHDLVNSGRKNACKLLSFPPEFQTGDGEDFDLRLSNKVFNSLKLHSNKEQTRRHKILDKKEDLATSVFGMDANTRLHLYRMIDSQLLEKVNGVISIGKEAIIFHAETDGQFPDTKEPLPPECVIKVFKTTLSEYKHRDKYIKDDHRFKDRVGKQNSSKIVHIWAEKEMANLMRLKKAGVPCPDVVTLKKHILVMSFIGENTCPAPKLKNIQLSDADFVLAYEQVIDSMKKLFEKANLIHADLSEYNILWHNDLCYFIDVSQSVEPCHDNAFYFLYRDCTNIINFFTKKGVQPILTVDKLFKHIVGLEYSDKVALLDLQESFKMKPHLVDKPGTESSFSFENAWEKSLKSSSSSESNIASVGLVDSPLA